MTFSRRNGLMVLILTTALAVSGCSTVGRLNPFKGKDDAKETAAAGERIAIVALDDKVAPAEALKGADFFLPEPAPVSQWPLPGGTPEQAMENVQAAPNLSVAWKRKFGQKTTRRAYVTAPPVAANGKIYVMDGEAKVSAFDAQSGSQVWRVDMRPKSRRDREAFGGGLAVADGRLYVSSGYRLVAALNADTGAVIWKTSTQEPVHAAPTVAAGRVFVVAVDNTLLTFDAGSGEPGWTYQGLSESARILAASSPAVSGDTVVASFGSGELVALRAANGNDLWSEALSRANRNNALSEIRDIPGRPVIYRGDVYAVSHSGVFSATDLRTGQARWSLPVVGITSPLPAGDVVYVVSKTGEVICAARETGQVYWVRDLSIGRTKKKSKFNVFGKKGTVRPTWSSPLLASNRLILTSSAGELVAINAKTGVVEKSVKLGAPTLIGPIAVNGVIYLATDEAQLIALR